MPVQAVTNTAPALVAERFSEGMNLARIAFDRNTTLTQILTDFAISLIAHSKPLDSIPIIASPDFEALDAMFNLTKPVIPTMGDFPALPVINAAPTTNFNYTESAYVSTVEDALKVKLVDKINNGGTGLGAVVEEGIWNREKERALLDHIDAIDRMAGEIGANGFPMPDGVMSAMLLDLETKYNDARLTSNRDISTKQADLAYQATQKFIDAGISFEGTEQTYATAMRNRLLEAAKSGPEIAVAMYRAEVERINVYVAQYNAIATKTNAQADIFRSQVAMYTSEADVKTKIIGASVQKYSAEIDAVAKANATELGKDEILVRQLTAFLNLELEAMKAVTQVNAQIAASALTGMSANASLGASAANSASTSESAQTTTNFSTVTQDITNRTA
jgi:hypothetical protein